MNTRKRNKRIKTNKLKTSKIKTSKIKTSKTKTRKIVKTSEALKSFLNIRRKKQTAALKTKRQTAFATKRIFKNISDKIELPDDIPEATGIAYKNIRGVQQSFTELALIDAKHDFPELAEAYKKYIVNYLPYSNSKDKILDQIQGFEKLCGIPFYKTLYNAINIKDPSVINVANTNREYLVYGKKISELNNGYDILDLLRKGSNKVKQNDFTFFIDTCSHHLLERIRTLSTNQEQKQKYTNPNVFLAHNREVICDPGSKTTKKTKPYLFNDIPTSVKLTQLDDIEVGNIEYSEFDETNKNILNDFYSNFDIVLGNPNNLFYKLVDNSSGKSVEYFSNIDENENSVSQSTQRIINNVGTVDGIIPFFQKRSGDWLQALSTLQRLRSYNPYPIKGLPILVTIDQPFLAYALKIGANVLFCQGENSSNSIEKSFIFFYNNSATREEDPLESFKLFFKDSQRYINAISNKNLLIDYYNRIIEKITNYLNKCLEQMKLINNLIIENDVKKFNKFYVVYHLLIIKKNIFTKNFKQFIEDPYKSLVAEPLDLETNNEQNLISLHSKESFVINVESYINKYNNDYVVSEINNLDKLSTDYTKCVKLDTFIFLDFGNLFKYEHISSDIFYLQKASIQGYYNYLATEEKKYVTLLLEVLSNPKFVRSKYINLFKELNIFNILTQEGGTNKIEKKSRTVVSQQSNMKEQNSSLNTVSLQEAKETIEETTPKTVSLKTHTIDEKEDAQLSIKYLELVIEDYKSYEKTSIVKFYNSSKLYLQIDLSLHKFHIKKLQTYLQENKDKDIYIRFINVLIELLYRNNIHTFDKSEVYKIFSHMKEPSTIIKDVSKIKDYDIQDSCLAVARQLYTETLYSKLLSDFPIYGGN